MKKLKLLLIGLFVLIGLSSFCSADDIFTDIIYAQDIYIVNDVNLNNSSYTNLFNYDNPTGNAGGNSLGNMLTGAGTYCIRFFCGSGPGCEKTLDMGFANGPTTAPTNLYKMYDNQYNNFVCLYGNKPYLNAKLNSSTNTVLVQVFRLEQLLNSVLPQFANITFHDSLRSTDTTETLNGGDIIAYSGTLSSQTITLNGNTITRYSITEPICPTCPICQNKATITIRDSYSTNNSVEFNSGDIIWVEDEIYDYGWSETGIYSIDTYNASPECPTIDQEYCENNFNLISPSNCPVCSGGVSNWSSLWINNIQHLGASSIYMSIPEEIDRDYSYSNSGEIMEIEVDGYNVDYDYINNLVSIQKYKPSSEDFTNIVSNLGAYFKILLFLVFAFLVIRRVSKPFRSKIK